MYWYGQQWHTAPLSNGRVGMNNVETAFIALGTTLVLAIMFVVVVPMLGLVGWFLTILVAALGVAVLVNRMSRRPKG